MISFTFQMWAEILIGDLRIEPFEKILEFVVTVYERQIALYDEYKS